MWFLPLGVVVVVVGVADAIHTLRFACSQLVVERLDPLVNPGMNPSPHMHQIVGGNAFNTTMPFPSSSSLFSPNSSQPFTSIAETSTCTTCTFTQDLSNYWTAVLYFRARNGTYKRVPQLPNQNLMGAKEGMTVYYISPDDKSRKITAFAPGFRMLAGQAEARAPPARPSSVNTFRCYTSRSPLLPRPYDPNPFGPSSNDTPSLPTGHCAGGIRVNTFFPTCWDGVRLDSPDHRGHVAYATAGRGGSGCPSTHPVELPLVFIETIWDTGVFDREWAVGEGVEQPFVFSQGDPTGNGHHADYMFGWKGDSLQKAMDARCDVYDATPDPGIYPASGCPVLSTQSMESANKCSQEQVAREEGGLDGWLTELPGGMPVTYT